MRRASVRNALELCVAAQLMFGVSSCAHHATPAPADSQVAAEAAPTTAPASDPSPRSSTSLQVTPSSDLPKLDLVARVGTYAAQDAVWVRGQPIVVNRDFDFAMATAIDGVGAGLAAARRQKENAELANKLATLDAIDPRALLQAKCAARPGACDGFYGYSIRLFGLLYGQRAARLRVVLELIDGADSDAAKPLYVSISDARAIDEFEGRDVLRSAFEIEIAHILDSIEASQPSEDDERCATGDSTYVTGKRIDRDASHLVLLASDPRSMIVRCNMQQ